MKQEDIEYLGTIIVEGLKEGPARDLIRAQMAASIFPACSRKNPIAANAAASLIAADEILRQVGI